MTTTNMSLNEPSVGVTTGPDWATQVNENFETIDTHDHTSGKGVQLTPSALNINADLEFNQNSATELKNVIFDSSVTAATTSYSVYQSGGNLYWRNGSGQAVQITSGTGINTSGGSISGMTGNAQVQFSNVNNSYTFKFDSTLTDGIAKVVVSDLQLYFYNSGSATTRSVNLKYTGSGTGSNTLTVPDETGTLLSTATSFAGAISVGATGGSGSITLDAQTDINLDSDSGVINFKDGGTAIGKISNSSSDLVIENEVDAKDIIFKQYDGNEVVRMADDRRLYFYDKGGEYIYGDGTDLNINSGTAINLNAGTLDLSAQTVDVTLNGAVDALNFDSNTLSIDASNNRVGIGTNAPNGIFNISNTTATDLVITTSDTNAAGEHWYLRNTIQNLYIGQATDSGGAYSGLTGRLAVLNGGDVNVMTGNLVIGTAGKGIDFSNQTSSTGTDAAIITELLDHYEWGTYRVILTPDSGSFTMDTGRDLLGFVKVGNICTVSGYARVSSSSGPSGLITFNLPFAASSMNEYANNFVGHAVPENLGNTPPSYYTSNDFHCFIDAAGATTAKIKRTAGGTAAGNWGGVADYFSTNTNVTISITYITA